MGRPSRTLEERFWEKVKKTEGCWYWTGGTRGHNVAGAGIPYGSIIVRMEGDRRVQDYAHRVSYRMHFGDIPDKMHVCHHCDNPLCVKPSHLFLGTSGDNQFDCIAKGRGNRETKAISFDFIDPDGYRISGKNLRKFCRDKHIHQHSMRMLNRGEIASYKGWKRFTG